MSSFLPDDKTPPACRYKEERASELRLRPKLQPRVLGDAREILVGGQHREVMANAQLRQKRVDRPDLDALSAAVIPQLRRINVIVTIRHDERQRRKALQYLGPA